VFEAMLALAVMLAAAWWTFGSRRDAGDVEGDDPPPEEPSEPR
jgi:hypothetical protein